MSELDLIKESIEYNPKTGVFVWKNISKHHSEKLGKKCGVWLKSKNKEYLVIQIAKKKWRAHRLAWYIYYGYIPNVIDHINGDTRDNRISNLRDVTNLENAQNHLLRDISKKKSKLPIGVRETNSGRFCARIRVNGTCITIGTYDTPEMAHDAYMKKRVDLHDCPTIK